MPPRAAPRGNPPGPGQRGGRGGGGGRGDGGGRGRGDGGGRGGRGDGRGGRGRGAPRGGGAPHPGSPQATGSALVAIPDHIQTIGVKRPDYGKAGRPLPLLVNAFPVVTNSEKMIYHYDAIQPDTLPSKFNMELIQHMQRLHADIFTPQAVYDGRKNMFAPHQLQLGPTNSREFDVPSPDGGGGNSRRPPKVFKVKLTKVNEINPVVLQRFVDQQQSVDENVLTAIMALNVVIRMEPIQKYPFNVRSFFTPEGKKAVGGGLELWRGYFQSLRPSMGRLIVNVDTSTGMMYRAGPLIELCLEFLGHPGRPELLSPAKGFPDRERLKLQKFINNLKVQISTGTSGPPKFGVIRGISRFGADKITFDHNGTRTNVAQYFRQKFNRPLRYPDMVCVEIGKGAMFPLEFCTVPEGQIARRQVPPDVTREMVAFSTVKPPERFRNIGNGIRLLAYGQSDYVRQFGLTIDTSGPIRLDARLLMPPKLQYGPGSKEKNIVPRNGSWNMADKKFFKPMTIKQWVVVIYETRRRFSEDQAQKLVKDLVSACASVGMTIVDTNPIVKWESGQGVIGKQIMAAGSECAKAKGGPPNLVVVILPENGDDIYKAVKHFGDVTIGVATQCLKSNKVFRANMQYWANVLLKVNVKLGGINLIPDQASVSVLTDPNKPTIVMGADVMHPAPGLNEVPSYAALVGSVDANVSKYIAVTDVQGNRVEMIGNLEGMCKAVLQKYVGYRKDVERTTAPLKRLIFYRDGVSEGQFEEVLEKELPRIKAACDHFGLKPTITLIVVGKRHHMRFKTQNEADADRSSNAPAGTVVDRGLGHPTEFDFYLQSHGGLLGTSRSSHYSVLYDDNKFNSDTLQLLSFALCHVYARSTRSVSIPAPVYYADIVCSRANLHYDPGMNISLSETMTTASEESTAVDRFKSGFKPLHNNQAWHMYFM
ncbi:hypothetical protein APHAL10511_007200 [Amanita phalloides]|nr:hypothetical protein APHAL10511_007200 [Amanita phalloides]